METKAQGLGYRIGSGFRRIRFFLKEHESRVVEKAARAYPKYGTVLARLLFLGIKISLVVLMLVSMVVAAYLAFLLLILAVMVAVLSRKGDDNSADEYNKYWDEKAKEYDYDRWYYYRDTYYPED